jgi:predicted dehydrogenase
MAVIGFAAGPIVTLGMSWDVFRHSNEPLEIHGDGGSLRLPDPDTFGGTVSLSEQGAPWRDIPTGDSLHGRINWPFDAPRLANYRMLGVADFARAVATGGTPRASGALALHVLEIMEGILSSAAQGSPVSLPEADVRPAALGEDEAASLHED